MITLTRKELTEQHFQGREPVLVSDGVADWPALSRWSPEALGALAGKRLVDIQVSRSGGFRKKPDGSPIDAADQFALANVPFADAVDCIRHSGPSQPKYYVSQQNIAQKLGELLADVRFPKPVQAAKLNLWFGSAGTITPLHFDGNNNLYAQIVGSKRWTLHDPADSPSLYQYPDGSRMSHISSVDVEALDSARFPLYPAARAISFTLEPGQLLYLPAFWWHHVVSLSVSISVNQWWDPELTHADSPNAVRMLRYEYRRDRWAGLRRMMPILTLRHLVDSSAALIATCMPLAVMSAAVALEELRTHPVIREGMARDDRFEERWPALVRAVAADEVRADEVDWHAQAAPLVRGVHDLMVTALEAQPV